MKDKKLLITVIILLFVNILLFSANDSPRVKRAKRFLKKARKHLKNKEYFRSRRYFERARRKFSILNHAGGLFEAYKGLGDVNMARGYLDRAFDMYNRAKYFAYKSGNVSTIAYVELCRNVAKVHASHRYYKNAIAFMKIAVSIGARVGDPMQGYNIAFLNKLQMLRKKYGDIGR